MLGFRRMRTLQKFVTVHSSLYNHFNLRRHLCSRDHFKIKRRRDRPVAPTRGGLILCHRWKTQTCDFSLTVPYTGIGAGA